MHHKDGHNVCFPSRVALHDPEGTRSTTKKKVAHMLRAGLICNLLSLKMIKNIAFSNDGHVFCVDILKYAVFDAFLKGVDCRSALVWAYVELFLWCE